MSNYPPSGYYWVQFNNKEKSTFIACLSWVFDVATWSVFRHEIDIPFEQLTILEGPLKCSVVKPPPKEELPTRYERILEPR
jgi:hypothetical protein